MASATAVPARMMPMTTEAAPSAHSHPHATVALTPASATTRPSIAAVSSKSTVKSVGSFESRTAWMMLAEPANAVELTVGERPRRPFEHHREAEHDEVDDGAGDRVRVQELLDALVDRHPGADGEDQDRHDEGPEDRVPPRDRRDGARRPAASTAPCRRGGGPDCRCRRPSRCPPTASPRSR